MFREEETDVLVVGAGPVGMLSALLLAKRGINVQIIDSEWRHASRSYACVLHPRSLKLLEQLGMSDLIRTGQRIETMAFYAGTNRQAELKFSQLPGDYPYLVALPQCELEGRLEKELSRLSGAAVRWNHRLSSLFQGDSGIVASVDKLEETASGYAVPNWNWVVGKTIQIRAAYLLGADGQNSSVRGALGIEYDFDSTPDTFEVYELACDTDLGTEAAVVFENNLTHVMWPLANRHCRWNFQVPHNEILGEFPSKERDAIVVSGAPADRERVQRIAHGHAPWFKHQVREIQWSSFVHFARRQAKEYGVGRCWLAGDAAHQTGPFGMQSMNIGVLEAEDLAAKLALILRKEATADLLATYNSQRRDQWQRLLGVKGGPKPGPDANAWVRQVCPRLLPCLPCSGEDLNRLAAQWGLVFE